MKIIKAFGYAAWMIVFVGGYFLTGCGNVHDTPSVSAQEPIISPTPEDTPEPEETPVPDRFEVENNEEHDDINICVIRDKQTGKRYMVVYGSANSIIPIQ